MHFVEIAANAVDFLKIFARLAEFGRCKNCAAGFGDNAGAVAVIFHFLGLLVQGLKVDTQTSRADKVVACLNGRRHCHD